ncbi:hypothetical protein LTS18_008818, partial [Coniosporium uncinatum]
MRFASACLCGAAFYAVAANAKVCPTRFDHVTWDDSNWRLTTTYADRGHYQGRMSLANGYIGINLASIGPFFERDIEDASNSSQSGWPLFTGRQTFATVGGFWNSQPRSSWMGTNFEWLDQYGGESYISGIPHWSGLVVVMNEHVLDANVSAEEIAEFSSTLDVGAGTMNWKFTWTPASEAALTVEYSMFVHKLHINQAAVQLRLQASRDINVTVFDVLQGDCAVRTSPAGEGYIQDSPTIWTVVRPSGIESVTAYIYSTLVADSIFGRQQVVDPAIIGRNESGVAQSFQLMLQINEPRTVSKYVEIASTNAFDDPQTVARQAAEAGSKAGYSAMLRTHIAEWESIMTRDTVDDFYFLEDGMLPDDPIIIEAQILAVTNPFHTLQNTVGANAILASATNTRLDDHSIAVCGLGSDCYAGWIFWDSEVWMAPGLVVTHPQAAQQVANYRVKLLPQARENMQTAFWSSQNETGKFTGGAAYPWVSGRFGNCTGAGPCFDYEHHLNGDIALEVYNYYVATGDSDSFRQNL